ncbi:hypothetical protein KDK_01810 [Dictyobacter kobayashii]|uniref:Uncharacterized protein n=1 Tax=Dictyobacter kobayashii TaxID=2014872 RepID=A0A402ABE1_9CHLR|nr:hypothetical protein KDK_01810 [Dictyobacter kobayashii]
MLACQPASTHCTIFPTVFRLRDLEATRLYNVANVTEETYLKEESKLYCLSRFYILALLDLSPQEIKKF